MHRVGPADALPQADAGPITGGQPVRSEAPKYPREARKEKLAGQVALDLTVNADGTVGDIAIISGDLTLAEEAVDAVRGWNFDPYTQDGKPVRVVQSVIFNFDPEKREAEAQPFPPATPPMRPGQTRSAGEGLYRVGHGVSAPRTTYAPNPPYTDKARKAKYQGVCLLSLIVDTEGTVRDIKIMRALGEGLDINAIDTVKQWRFDPAMRDGEPVAVSIDVEVSFHLY